MTVNHSTNHHRTGFTLTELAVALVLSGLFAGLYMSVTTTTKPVDCVAATRVQLETIKGAVYRYVDGNDRFPLPALRTVGSDNPSFGAEETDVTKLNSFGPGVIAFGSLPFKTLGLDPSYASDCWGNKFSYAVTVGLTNADDFKKVPPDSVVNGQIVIGASNDVTAAPLANNMAFAVISHGANGLGAVQTNYEGTDTKLIASHGTTLESGNFDFGDDRIINAPYNDGANANTQTFDDLVVYGGKSLRRADGKASPTTKFVCEVGELDNPITPAACGTPFTWTCKGISGGNPDQGVLANPCQVAGACGDAVYHIFPPSTPPTTDLCADGTLPTVTQGPTSHTWVCHGVDGGPDANCFANYVAGPPNGECTTPWGAKVPEGTTVTAFNTESAADCGTHSETRTCTAGILSFSAGYIHATCTTTVPGNCVTPWGDTVLDGSSVIAYSVATHANCSSVSETRTCNNGVLSGSFTNPSCQEGINLYACMAGRYWSSDPQCRTRIPYTQWRSGSCVFNNEPEATDTRFCGFYTGSANVTMPGCVGNDRGGQPFTNIIKNDQSQWTVICTGSIGGR